MFLVHFFSAFNQFDTVVYVVYETIQYLFQPASLPGLQMLEKFKTAAFPRLPFSQDSASDLVKGKN